METAEAQRPQRGAQRRSRGTRDTRYQQALQAIAKSLNSTPEVAEVLRQIVASSARAMQVKGCSLMLLSPDGKELLAVATHGLSRRYLAKGPVLAERSVGETLTGPPVYVADAPQDPRIQYPEAAQREGIASILSLPLRLRDKTIGVFRLYSGKPREFTPQQMEFLGAMADLGAIALESAKYHASPPRDDSQSRQELLEWYAGWELERKQEERGVRFAHPSEEEFARLLDFYRVKWYYEPRSFPLAWEGDRIVEMFTPDFYLPQLDLYLELTTMKQSLVTQKHRKVRRLRELYPDVNLILLNRKDYHKLLTKYGYRPMGETEAQRIGRILLTEAQIEERIKLLGLEITRDYAGKGPVLVGVLKGVMCFMADLVRHIAIPLELDYLALSSYEGTLSGAVRIVKDLSRSVAGREVLLIEDIVDTGMTLHWLLEHLQTQNPASLEVCTLLDKRARRLLEVPLKYVGFEIPDEYVVGYGLDYREEYRNLPFIATLKPDTELP